MSDVRSFLALELPPEVISALLEVGNTVRDAAPEWRGEKWVASQNLHITLKFLGNRSRADLDGLAEAMTFALADPPPLTLKLGGVRAVPSARRASMLWAAFTEPDGTPVTRLARLADELAEGIGVERDRRSFAPHATLVRARRPHSIDLGLIGRVNTGVERRAVSMSDPSITLFASTLTPVGPVYERLAEWRPKAR